MACGQLLTQQGFARAAGAGEIGCLPVRDVAGPRPLPLGGLNVLPLRGINQRQQAGDLAPFILGAEQGAARSEEHTSELQSLMRISYAVFCLKKKKEHVSNSPIKTKQKNESIFRHIKTSVQRYRTFKYQIIYYKPLK